MRVVGLLLAVALTAWAGFQVVVATAGTVTRHEHRAFAAPRELTISSDSGDVRLTRSSSRRLIVDSRLSASLRTPRLHAELRAGRLTLASSCHPLDSHCSASFVVAVPAGTAVTVSTDSGTVTADHLTKGARINSDSGSIRVRDSAGPLELAADSGSIDVADVRSGRVGATVDSGAISLVLGTAPRHVSATTDSGSVEIRVPRDRSSYRVQHSTDSGSERVDVRTDPGSPRTIRATTDSGSIDVGYR